MPKISKQKAKLHHQAEEYLAKDELTLSEKEFVYANWLPSYDHNTGWIAAFFTPIDMTYEFTIYCPDSGRIVDLAAGIGGLSFALLQRSKWNEDNLDLVCIERSQKFYEVGKKLLPEATWIQGDIFDEAIWKDLGKFTHAISNPPFGQIKQHKGEWLGYNGVADLMAVEVAMKVASGATFILPQNSVPFKLSGITGYERVESRNFEALKKVMPDICFQCSSSDTSIWKKEWLDTSPTVEIVNIEEERV